MAGIVRGDHTISTLYPHYIHTELPPQTRVLAINEEEELDEAELPGFDAAAHTLYCGNTVHNHLVQVIIRVWGAGWGGG